MPHETISPRELFLHRTIAGLVASSRTQKEMMIDLLVQTQQQDRATIESAYKAIHAKRLEEYFLALEGFDPGLAAQIDYRKL